MSTTFERREITPQEMRRAARDILARPGWRFGHLTARPLDGGMLALELLLLDTAGGAGTILSARLPEAATAYPSLTPQIPAAHWAERAIGDLFHLRAENHPRWKSLLLHEAWPEAPPPLRAGGGESSGREPYRFLEVEGAHEIPVGPIHAGIIEPGHFRFSCHGEVIANLEIRLGYQHRGLERRLAEIAWQ